MQCRRGEAPVDSLHIAVKVGVHGAIVTRGGGGADGREVERMEGQCTMDLLRLCPFPLMRLC